MADIDTADLLDTSLLRVTATWQKVERDKARILQAADELDSLRAQLQAANERAEQLSDALATIASLAVGEGDVCEIIARRARAALEQDK